MKKVLKVVVDVLAWIILIAAFLVTLMVFSSSRNNGIASLFGIMPMSVQTDSMAPTFKAGDLIFVKKIDDLNALSKDDVITFYTIIEGARTLNTHRIAEINDSDGIKSFITRGDNNMIDDEIPIYASDIVGKWTGKKIPGAGKVLTFLRSKTGFFVCIVIPMALFFLFELYKFVATMVESKQKMTKEDEEEIKRKAIEEYLAAQQASGNTQADVPAQPAPEMVTEGEQETLQTDSETAVENVPPTEDGTNA